MKRTILLSLLTLAPGLATTAELRVTPSVCALDEGENQCSVLVKLDFEADDEARYCLSIIGQGRVSCFWGDNDDLKVYVSSAADIRFQVTANENGQSVASAILKVGQYQPKRHRRRYGWGLL
ncbi:DUF3019 domain-containing protein [uncultured Microbulbifer sp.]|uniref:DUF3019 domain-containing protein n=1 Tax=uncultured Microbulbifer sp. TaxID=348147 RepID=UPI0026033029|nr:DUF3019 domain-containing protein [uncultured Microbulbifer sp.]